MSQNVLSFKDVSKTYGRQDILSAVNLSLAQGDYLALVGANGAGKTTLLKCLLDFTAISAGSIAIFDEPQTMTSARQRLAYLPERFTPPYYLTGKDFLVYMAGLYGEAYNPEQVEIMLSVLDLEPSALDKPVRQFSKGMSQKLGLAACLLSNRELLIMDEPMSGLDPKARAYLKQYLIELKQQGKTLFFSTHLLADVEILCDKVAILHEGSIQFMGSPAECCQHFVTDDFEQAYLRCIGG